MIELPYGIADFRSIRREGLVYVDRTAHIRDIERLGRILVFLRPRRFGKSLWLQTLANYYDLRRKDEFEELFGDLAIGRHPTPRANRYFVLQWNFSEVSVGGGIQAIGESLRDHVAAQVEAFASDYEEHLPATVNVDGPVPTILARLLSAIRKTPYKLYLLIDEYDNFVNEVMAKDIDTYRALFDDGPYKELFKSVKSATEGRGLERVFVTGVSPVALNDLTSGFNTSTNVSLDPDLAFLCGFRKSEVRDLLGPLAEERGLTAETVEEAVGTMRIWYNGYRFTEQQRELVYNPTNSLYFLQNLYLRRKPPRDLHDENLRTDRNKLAFLARTSAGSGLIEELTQGENETVTVSRLEKSFSLDDLMTRMEEDRSAVASFLFYLGMLTLTPDVPPRLRIPNLVVRKLFFDRLLEIYLPKVTDNSQARAVAAAFLQDGELPGLLSFFEDKILPVLSNRDRGAAPQRPGQSGSGVNEMVIKSLFLSLLFDDQRYVISSEPELERGYADLLLLVRQEMRQHGFFDVLFEFKLVRRNALGKKGQALRDMDEAALRELTPVKKALAEARAQVRRYREGLPKSPPVALDLRCYVVAAVGLERMVGEEMIFT